MGLILLIVVAILCSLSVWACRGLTLIQMYAAGLYTLYCNELNSEKVDISFFKATLRPIFVFKATLRPIFVFKARKKKKKKRNGQ